MYKEGESNLFYYITVMNEPYVMPAHAWRREGRHPEGMYKIQAGVEQESQAARRSCLESGAILTSAAGAADSGENYGVAADVMERDEL